MEQAMALKQAEGRLAVVADKIHAYQSRLDDFVFRAQRISAALKNKQKINDSMFGYELQGFRRDIRQFSSDVASLPAALSGIVPMAHYEEASFRSAESVSRVAQRVQKGLSSMHDRALMAHQFIREADFKIEAWYLCQEINEMAQKGQALPGHANKILILITTPPAAPPSAPPK